MVENSLPEGRKTDRKSYLKGLLAGLIGATAISKLKDLPEANAANTYLKLGDIETNNDAGSSYTGMLCSTNNVKGTLYVLNTSDLGTAIRAEGGNSGIDAWCTGVTGTGVRANGPSRGVYGHGDTGVEGSSDSGIGVAGYADATSGTPRGVLGTTESIMSYNYDPAMAGVHGVAKTSVGVLGEAVETSGTTTGVRGKSYSASGYGVHGQNTTSGTGVCGESQGSNGAGVSGVSSGPSGAGVLGFNADGRGVVGVSTTGYGVLGSVLGTGIGVLGSASASGGIPIVAQGSSLQAANLQEWQNNAGKALSVVDKDGKLGVGTSTPAASIHGETGLSNPAIKGRNTGTGDGIRGESSGGYGLIGTTAASSKAGIYGYGSGSAVGVRAKSASGFALYVVGKNYFKSAKKGTIPSGVSQYEVTVPSGVAIGSGAMIFVTLMSNPGGVSVKWVKRLSDTQFRIYLTGATSSKVAFGYFIVN